MNSVVRLPNIFQDVVNPLTPSYIYLLTLAQVMAWHLKASSLILPQPMLTYCSGSLEPESSCHDRD